MDAINLNLVTVGVTAKLLITPRYPISASKLVLDHTQKVKIDSKNLFISKWYYLKTFSR